MITAVMAASGCVAPEETLAGISAHPLIKKGFVLCDVEPETCLPGRSMLAVGSPLSGETWNILLEKITTRYTLFCPWAAKIRIDPRAPERLVAAAESTGAGMVYADYADEIEGALQEHPLIDCQTGSLRDDFSFGPLILLSTAAVRRAIRKYGKVPPYRWAGWYDLRLKLSADRTLFHLPERLCIVEAISGAQAASSHFAYVDPRNRLLQEEMEAAVTAHLQRIGAFLPPECKEMPRFPDVFDLEASVVVPVRNRVRTVAEAVESALTQQTDFPFNVIVVDNHSTDGTTALLAELAEAHPALVHLVPEPDATFPSAAAGTRRSSPRIAAGMPSSSTRTTSTAAKTRSSGWWISCAGRRCAMAVGVLHHRRCAICGRSRRG